MDDSLQTSILKQIFVKNYDPVFGFEPMTSQSRSFSHNDQGLRPPLSLFDPFLFFPFCSLICSWFWIKNCHWKHRDTEPNGTPLLRFFNFNIFVLFREKIVPGNVLLKPTEFLCGNNFFEWSEQVIVVWKGRTIIKQSTVVNHLDTEKLFFLLRQSYADIIVLYLTLGLRGTILLE